MKKADKLKSYKILLIKINNIFKSQVCAMCCSWVIRWNISRKFIEVNIKETPSWCLVNWVPTWRPEIIICKHKKEENKASWVKLL